MLQKFLLLVLYTQQLFRTSRTQGGSCPTDSLVSFDNECASNPCIETTECVDGFNRYLCYCNKNYTRADCRRALTPNMYTGRSCLELYWIMCGELEEPLGTPLPAESGPYPIYDTVPDAYRVFCDFSTGNQPWTVIQRRTGCEVSFYRNWTEYKNGFGNPSGDYWLGNDRINKLTTMFNRTVLRIELTDWGSAGTGCFIEYDNFKIADATDKYRLLSIGNFTGTCGDSMSIQVGQQFSTYDQDNDSGPYQSCAVRYQGAWWYNNCFHSNLNGLYVYGGNIMYNGICWYSYRGYGYSYQSAVMKIRKYTNS